VERVNEANIVFDAAQSVREVDGNGYLHVALTNISKANVRPYYGREIPGSEEHGYKPEQIYYALCAPYELAKAAATFNGLPPHLDHHVDSAQDPQKEHRVDSTGTDAIYEAPYLKNSLSVTDAEAIKAIESGEYKEISAAYRYTPDFTPGKFEGVDYDFVMRNIAGNHIALVQEGRAGHDVVVADSSPPTKDKKENERKRLMSKKRKLKALKAGILALDEVLKEKELNKEEQKALDELVEVAKEEVEEEPVEDEGEEIEKKEVKVEEIKEKPTPDSFPTDEVITLLKELLVKIEAKPAEDEGKEDF